MSIGDSTTVSTLANTPWKSGTSTSTRAGSGFALIACAVAAKCAAPPSGRSSRSTDVTTTCCKPSRATASAIRRGSSASSGRTLPCATAQYGQFRVHTSPISMKVAVRCEKHSPIFGQHASWQTECSLSSPRIALVRKYSGDTGARTLIQSGCFRSAIVYRRLWRSLYVQRARNNFTERKHTRETLAHHAGELAHRHRALRHFGHRRHAASLDPARHDRIEVAEIGGYVQREAVPRRPAPDTDANRRDLAGADPHAGHPVAAPGVDSESCERVDHRALETPKILGNVAIAPFKLENRIADQLPGPVIRDFPATRHPPNRHTFRICHDEPLISPAPKREHVRMLHHQKRIANGPLDPSRQHRALHRKRRIVINDPQLRDGQASSPLPVRERIKVRVQIQRAILRAIQDSDSAFPRSLSLPHPPPKPPA